jgi:hypothetical protein
VTRSRGINRPKFRWDVDSDALLRELYPDSPSQLLADRFGCTLTSLYQHAYKLGLAKSAEYLASPLSGRTRPDANIGGATRFKRGQMPANKGLRRPGWAPGRMASTQFKKGVMTGAAQHNYVPIGTERISKDGYPERKVSDDPNVCPARRWVAVHRLVWEAANGPIPPGHVVVFRPGRKTSDVSLITLDAIELVTRVELMRRNSYHTNYPKEVAQLIQLKGALNRKINKRQQRHEEQDERRARSPGRDAGSAG